MIVVLQIARLVANFKKLCSTWVSSDQYHKNRFSLIRNFSARLLSHGSLLSVSDVGVVSGILFTPSIIIGIDVGRPF
jgi:hypothetical protein